MDNQQPLPNESPKEKQAPAGSGTGSDAGANPLITEARSAAERLEKASIAAKLENDRREQLAAADILGGRSGGPSPVAPPKPLDPREYARAVLRGQIPPKPE